MTELRQTHRITVTEDMIDHLGHMNVGFYGLAARAGSAAVARELGTGDLVVEPVDIYTRHFREQHLGAHLEVRSLVLGGGDGSLRLYHELRNRDTDELAASFVHRLEARSGGEIQPAWPPPVDAEGAIPEHGRPRSIELDTDPVASAPTLEQVRADPALGWRHPRAVEADECGPDGAYDPGLGAMLLWGGESLAGGSGPTLHAGPDGQLIGWAAMEHRLVFRRRPRRGDRIQAFACTLAASEKAPHRLLWAFDVERGDLLVTLEVIDVALDTVSRRAVPIPADLRADIDGRMRPELRPR